MKDQRRRGCHSSALRREGEEADRGAGGWSRRADASRTRAHQLLPARKLAALVGHQHLPEAARRRGRPQGGRIRRRIRGGVRHRLHVPHGHCVRAARDARISMLYQKYSYEHGDRPGRDARHVRRRRHFLPANITKGHDQITSRASHILSYTLPMTAAATTPSAIPSPCVAQCVEGNVGIIHVDRHVDTQDKDMDEIMHTCPWFHATNIPNCPPKNLVHSVKVWDCAMTILTWSTSRRWGSMGTTSRSP